MINPKDPNDVLVRIGLHSNTMNYTSALLQYFTETQTYLKRKYSENANVDFSQSNHFIKKDTHEDNNEQTEQTEELYLTEQEENEDTNDDNNINTINDNNVQMNYYMHHQQQQFNNNIHNRPRYHSVNDYNNDISSLMNMFHHSNNVMQQQQQQQVQLQHENGKRGWICGNCGNYNYSSRKHCNKCNIPRNNIRKQNKQIRMYNQEDVYNKSNNNTMNVNTNTNNTKFSERVGDWVCFNCDNLNFAFRTVCNRCQLPKQQHSNMK